MPVRRIVLLLILPKTAVSPVVVGIVVSVLYHTAVPEERARRVETVQSRARLIESVIRWEREEAIQHPTRSGRGIDDVMSILTDAHEHYGGFG